MFCKGIFKKIAFSFPATIQRVYLTSIAICYTALLRTSNLIKKSTFHQVYGSEYEQEYVLSMYKLFFIIFHAS